MSEQYYIKAIRAAEIKHNLPNGLLIAVAKRESNMQMLGVHSDGTSTGMFGLRESTSIAEYIERVGSRPDLGSVEGQAEVAGWYLGNRIPKMIKYYKKPVTVRNQIIAYNAGISYVQGGDTPPDITLDYIEFVNAELENVKKPNLYRCPSCLLHLQLVQ